MNNKRSLSLIQKVVHRPRSLRLRRALFQVHLWAGVVLTLYVTAIGITGSILVFREELHALNKAHKGEPLHPAITMSDAVKIVAQTAPGKQVTVAFPPSSDNPAYAFVIPNHPVVYVDATSGKPATPVEQPTWLDFISALHVELLLGREPGRSVNGLGAVGLLLLTITGLLLWWPGIASLSNSLLVDFRRNWRRVIWDLHAVTGLYGLAMLVVWSLTGILFIWPVETRAALAWVSPISQPPVPRLPARDMHIETMLAHVDAAVSRLPGRFRWVLLPEKQGQPLTLVVSRELGDHAEHYDNIYLDPSTGDQVGVWRADDGKSFSDWILRLSFPLHTGMYWGLFIKILWSLLGLLLPILGITGLLMYWNRFLRWKWRLISTLQSADTSKMPERF